MTTHRAWAVDPANFSTRNVCPLRHNFHEHPLMQLSELGRLARDLYPKNQCRFIKPGSTQASAFSHEGATYDGRNIDEVFRRIEEPGSWVALYNVETDPLYRQFLDEVIVSVRDLTEREQPGIFNVGGFIFISAPPSVTPFHIDRENNFWLQVAGRKIMNVWDNTDRVVVSAEAVEKFIVTGALADVKLKEEYRSRSHQFDVGPGDGVYFPSTSPHMTSSDKSWVVPGDGVSISIGVVFYSDVTRRHARAHAGNRVLRKAGLSPAWPGGSSFVDTAKYPLGYALVKARQWLRGHTPPVGF